MIIVAPIATDLNSANSSNTLLFREKLLINVFHRIRTPEMKLFNFVRIIRIITVTYAPEQSIHTCTVVTTVKLSAKNMAVYVHGTLQRVISHTIEFSIP